MKILVAGWFSFPNGHATAGDLMARDVVCEWFREAGLPFDVASAPPFAGSVDLETLAPSAYSHLVFVCGPFERGELETELLHRFRHCRVIGLNLSVAEPLERWNPFDLLVERDSSRAQHPDLVFLARAERVPVVGLCLVEPHPGADTDGAEAAIERLIASRAAAVVPIDTRLDRNSTGLRTPAEVGSLIAKVDLLITTRLHGMVLALTNGVPVVAIDPIPGGAKICRQARTVGWRAVAPVDELTDAGVDRMFEYCLGEEARSAARACSDGAARELAGIRRDVIGAFLQPHRMDESFRKRLTEAAALQSPAPPPAAPRTRLRRLLGRMIPGRPPGRGGTRPVDRAGEADGAGEST
jgi:hypothetical protein